MSFCSWNSEKYKDHFEAVAVYLMLSHFGHH